MCHFRFNDVDITSTFNVTSRNLAFKIISMRIFEMNASIFHSNINYKNTSLVCSMSQPSDAYWMFTRDGRHSEHTELVKINCTSLTCVSFLVNAHSSYNALFWMQHVNVLISYKTINYISGLLMKWFLHRAHHFILNWMMTYIFVIDVFTVSDFLVLDRNRQFASQEYCEVSPLLNTYNF